MGKVVCVTGASGYIASWLVKLLLQRGYTVKATVRNLNDPSKVAHLKALEGAEERLHLYEANLVEEGCFDSVVEGCEGVFHTASPAFLSASDPQKGHEVRPTSVVELGIQGLERFKFAYQNSYFKCTNQKELIDPAVQGTMNVLKSCKKVLTIKRVVVTSSMATVNFKYIPLAHDVVVDETWPSSDPASCEKNKEWYALSKTLAEKATWGFAEENGLDLVMLHPGFVIGPPLQPTLGLSCEAFLSLIKEGKELWPSGIYRYIDVRDVALAHILALESSCARGKYFLVGRVVYSSEALDILRHIFPSLSLPAPTKTEKQAIRPPYQVSQERAKSLGISFMPLELTIKDTVESFRDNNFMTF